MIDTHCHLDLLKKEDYEEAIKDNSLEYLITVGYDRKTIQTPSEFPKRWKRSTVP
jgi:TatD DNase family protein